MPVYQKAHHGRQQINQDEDDIIDADQLEIGVGEFRTMLLIGDPLPDQLPHHQEVGDRRQGGEDDLEQPDLRQRHHAQFAKARVERDAAVFPQALQSAERPAETLLAQAAEGGGRFRPGDGGGVEQYAIARGLDGDGEILIFRQRVGGKAAHIQQRLAPPGADSARNYRQRVQRRKRPALQILRHDIFQRLPARDHVDAVAHFGVARHRADFRIGEPAHQARNGIGIELGIGVQRHHHRAGGLAQSDIESVGLAAIGNGDQRDAFFVGEATADHFRGMVGRSIVDHQHFQIAIVAGKNPLDRQRDHFFFIVSRDQDGHRLAGMRDRRHRGVAPGKAVEQRQPAQHQKPRHAKYDRADEAVIKKLADERQAEKYDAVGVQHHGQRQPGHHLVIGETTQLRDRHEAIAFRPHAIDQDGKQLDGLGAVAAGIMHQHDIAAQIGVGVVNLLLDQLHHLIDRQFLPVQRVDMRADRQIAKLLRFDDGHDLVGIAGLGVAQIRRAQHPHRTARQRFEQTLGRVQFQTHGCQRRVGQIGVSEGVIAHFMPLGQDALHQPRMRFHIRADDEEAGLNMLGLQNVEDLRRPVRIGSVIESQRQLLGRLTDAMNHKAGGQASVFFVDDVAGILLDLQIAKAGLRIGFHPEDLAFGAVQVDVFGIGGDVFQVRRGRQIVALAHQGQHRGILGAEPPQGIASGSIVIGGVDLVEHRHGIQEPDVMVGAVAFAVGEMRIVGGLVELDGGAGIARRAHRVMEGQYIGAPTIHPVIGIGAQRDDRRIGRQFAHAPVENFFVPALSGDRARLARIVVLVIGHQHRVIDDLRISLVRPVAIIERGSLDDDPAMRGEQL